VLGRTAPAFRASPANLYAADLIGSGLTRPTLGDTDAAERVYRNALDLYRTTGSPLGQATATLGLGELARVRSDYGTAERLYRNALHLYRTTGSPLGQATATLGLGELAHVRSDYGTAERLYRNALHLYRTTGSPLGQATATLGLGLTQDERAMLNAMDPKDRARYLLQRRINEKAEMAELLSQLQELRHQTAMSVINNIR
jgi:tetratricopeptide (TPR) repeat protein